MLNVSKVTILLRNYSSLKLKLHLEIHMWDYRAPETWQIELKVKTTQKLLYHYGKSIHVCLVFSHVQQIVVVFCKLVQCASQFEELECMSGMWSRYLCRDRQKNTWVFFLWSQHSSRGMGWVIYTVWERSVHLFNIPGSYEKPTSVLKPLICCIQRKGNHNLQAFIYLASSDSLTWFTVWSVAKRH